MDKTNKARVILLNPPTASVSTEIMLGLAYLASTLRRSGHEVKVIDATAPYAPMSREEIEKTILDFKPDFIGITITISYIAQTYAYLETLRKIGIPVVAGGSHVNPLPEEALAHGADVVAIGEGEQTILELADYFCGNTRDMSAINGLCFKDDRGNIRRTPPRALIKDIDSIPFPAFEDFPIRNYTGSDDVDSNPNFWSVFTSRGCPFNCTFCCGHNVFGRSSRLRSAENVFDEIRYLVNTYGAKKITFQDDEILLSRERVLKLCDLIKKDGLKFKMSIRSRITSIDEELLNRLREAGLTRISFGIESWNDDTLNKVKKRYMVKDIEKSIEILDRTRFPLVHLTTLIGFPWETKEHLRENLRVLSKIPRSIRYFLTVGIPVPYPNTELYNEYREQYGFANWWLDPDKDFNNFFPKEPRPVFFFLAKSMGALYFADLYWLYPKRWWRDMEWFVWKVYSLQLRRHFNIIERMFAYWLARASYRAWKTSPKLENSLFKLVPRRFVSYVENKLSFAKAE